MLGHKVFVKVEDELNGKQMIFAEIPQIGWHLSTSDRTEPVVVRRVILNQLHSNRNPADSVATVTCQTIKGNTPE